MSFIILLPIVLLLIGAAYVIDWLFPSEEKEYKHYEGTFGTTADNYKSWDEMTREEKEDSAVRMFK